MTTKQETLINKGMYVSLGLVIGVVVFAFSFGGAWSGLGGQTETNTRDIALVNSRLDKMGEKQDLMIERQGEASAVLVRLTTQVEGLVEQNKASRASITTSSSVAKPTEHTIVVTSQPSEQPQIQPQTPPPADRPREQDPDRTLIGFLQNAPCSIIMAFCN